MSAGGALSTKSAVSTGGTGRRRWVAPAVYGLFGAVAPFWFTPHAAGPREYGFHWLVTLVANCFLLAGLAFGAYMALTQLRLRQRAEDRAEDREAVAGLRVG